MNLDHNMNLVKPARHDGRSNVKSRQHFRYSKMSTFVILNIDLGSAGLRLRGAPKLRMVLVPLPLEYLVVFNKFHAFFHIYISLVPTGSFRRAP